MAEQRFNHSREAANELFVFHLLCCHTVSVLLMEGGPELPKVFAADVSCSAFGTGNKKMLIAFWANTALPGHQLSVIVTWAQIEKSPNREKVTSPDFSVLGLVFCGIFLGFFGFFPSNLKLLISHWKHSAPALISNETKGSENGEWPHNQKQQVELNSFAGGCLPTLPWRASCCSKSHLCL